MIRLYRVALGVMALCVLAGRLPAEDRKYTLQDLQALEKRQAWNELIMHMQDIPPAERQAEWNRIMVEACLVPPTSDSYVEEWCAGELKSVVLSESGNTELAWKAGKWVRMHQAGWVAVPFFAKAITKPGDARCKDEDVALAVMSGLGLPVQTTPEVVKLSQVLAFKTCWSDLKGALKKEFSQESGYFRDNTCTDMKAKGVLSSLQAKKCK